MSNVIFQWLFEHYIEIFAAIAGLLYLFFSIRQNIWLWPLGLVTSALFVYVFFTDSLYADMGLNVYYVVISIYGWYHWLYSGETGKKNSLKVSRLSKWLTFKLILLTFIVYWVLVFALHKLPEWFDIAPAELLYLDAFTTAASVVATWMLARKIIEHWIVWIVIDSLSMGMYFYKGLYPTMILFFVYTIMAIKGYTEWKKDLQIPEK
ncbi:MAG: nicotinamide mononucleotide transporter [Bacteroidales bacterium]|nr:nicotinamide mononucleotide transporter [Bacteroidales bacterium]